MAISVYERAALARKNIRKNKFKEQTLFFKWAEVNTTKYPELKYIHCTLNGDIKFPISTLMRIKKIGMKSEVLGIHLPSPNNMYLALYMEIKMPPKTNTKAFIAKNKLDYIDYLNSKGYLAIIAFGANMAIKIVEEYLKNEDLTSLIDDSKKKYARKRHNKSGSVKI